MTETHDKVLSDPEALVLTMQVPLIVAGNRVSADFIRKVYYGIKSNHTAGFNKGQRWDAAVRRLRRADLVTYTRDHGWAVTHD